ncbi:MAG: hypothetical protein Q4G70_11290 [Pseudomonadota bacterium]|nr:hypothetical protein [Pseudomonadota bacterium]
MQSVWDDLSSSADFESALAQAEEGDVLAQFAVGVCYATGHLVAKDDREALRWYQQAAWRGSLAAMYNSNWLEAPDLIRRHGGVLQLPHECDIDFLLAQPITDGVAMWLIGLGYEHGTFGLAADPTKAFQYFKLGADQDYSLAICSLGYKYEKGSGTAQDLEAAVRLYRVAADRFVDVAYYNLGCLYKDGLGVPQDDDEAAQWFERAMDADGDWAQAAEDAWNTMPNGPKQKALLMLEDLQAKEHVRPSEDFLDEVDEVATSVYNPERPALIDIAFPLYSYASEHGHVNATHMLGLMHKHGYGTPIDIEKAEELFLRAVEKGCTSSPEQLARLYSEDGGPKKDEAKAKYWQQRHQNRYADVAARLRKEIQDLNPDLSII